MALKKFEIEEDDVLAEVLEGLQKREKELPCKLFYDEKGSSLFDEICGLDEYYLTRTEMAIMDEYIGEISGFLGNNCLLIELGSGSSKKIRLILDHLQSPAAYVPIDISLEHLMKSVRTLAEDYPQIKIVPVYADFTKPFHLPSFNLPWSHKVIYYPGSSIGNFTPSQSVGLLKRFASMAGKGGGLLIGVDLKKDRKTLEAAYNDKKGVTAAFNLNILERLNREFSADFDLKQWKHLAFYSAQEGRMEIYLESQKNQRARINDSEIFFEKGERILTEYSYKYAPEELRELLSGIFNLDYIWLDREQRFSVQYLSVL